MNKIKNKQMLEKQIDFMDSIYNKVAKLKQNLDRYESQNIIKS